MGMLQNRELQNDVSLLYLQISESQALRNFVISFKNIQFRNIHGFHGFYNYDNNNKSISIAPWLEVSLYKGADTKQIKNSKLKMNKKYIKKTKIKKMNTLLGAHRRVVAHQVILLVHPLVELFKVKQPPGV